jgi:photosystem II stability/assembly factor-like uncharacterized protein
MRLTDFLRLAFVSLVGLVGNGAIAGGEAARVELKPVPAAQSPIANQAMMLGMTWAGSRVVAVGDHGIVLLSDDNGASFRQAKSVPVSSMLTAVTFVDARHGWAVGHWGAILVTDDGGETWRIQRLATSEDRPLFSVYFFDEKKGVAVGLWSLVLTTVDGGQTWSTRELPPPPGASKADLNLLGLFSDTRRTLYVAAEHGFVLRSEDLGATWTYLNTGYKGSFWSGIALSDEVLIVGGQRGTAYRSADAGKTWTRIETGSKNSITGFARRGDAVLAVGLDGLLALSRDGGKSFVAASRPDRLSLTAVLSVAAGGWITASQRGIFLEGSQ